MPAKRNQVFCYLYALAIIMVIDDHCNTRIGLLSSVFPYNSFYMPLFVFASGYFYKARGIIDTVVHKVKKILVPYIVFDIVMIIISYFIDFTFGLNWHREISLDSINNMLIYAPTTDLNNPAWFAIMLFWVSVLYAVIRVFCPTKNRIVDHIIMGCTIAIGFVSIFICVHYPEYLYYYHPSVIFILRTLFYIQFYHLGYMFKEYYEPLLVRVRKGIVCTACMLVNVVLIAIFGDSINFYSTCVMNSFRYTVLPLVTSITGIIFYYEVMSFLSERIGENKIISFISRNTFVIMEVHLLFVNIPNLFIYNAIKHGSQAYGNFPVDQFLYSPGVRYSSNALLIGFFCGVIGSLSVAYIIEVIKRNLRSYKTAKTS